MNKTCMVVAVKHGDESVSIKAVILTKCVQSVLFRGSAGRV
jgi:hypothetical protein